jgi:molybdopterin molybdotransferase
MITVAEAENMILGTTKDFGSEVINLDEAMGRVLAEDLLADRDMPAFNRATMDGIAIRYEAIEKGITTFQCKGVQGAGDHPLNIEQLNECVEIMTGSALPPSTDTIIRYEDVSVLNGTASIQSNGFKKAQNVHAKGMDTKQATIVAHKGCVITPGIISMAASVGASRVCVKKLPKVVIITTGNEMVAIDQSPSPYQVRQSNGHTINASLKPFGVQAQLMHIDDDLEITKRTLENCLNNFHVLILTGGISAGRFDFLSPALEAVGVEKHFHKVAQKPGKPFWFGQSKDGVTVFAFPGNPVSCFLCTYRYLLPWLRVSLGLAMQTYKAVVSDDIRPLPSLQYFALVKLHFNENGQLMAKPIEGNGSGDIVSLAEADAFMELPPGKEIQKGQLHTIWPFKDLL